MLILPIKKKWFDMIADHEKEDEYREIKPYWTKRFAKAFGIHEEKLLSIVKVATEENVTYPVPVKSQIVAFKNGYAKEAPILQCKVLLLIGQGMEEWGAEKDTWYFVLKIIDIKNQRRYIR